ncbi:hypothetical protein [Novosphingobium album (ex Liu et al. 2023)]|uniref:hypothetical protein n=1 Tax=Novosphingobium album (ex Liu et al. 2023) TaxID=3031130 RepID=UPI0023B09208|nr:hypothetical protein [Novosphingobium album (ex Liu et al. 2023)]
MSRAAAQSNALCIRFVLPESHDHAVKQMIGQGEASEARRAPLASSRKSGGIAGGIASIALGG